MTSPFCEDFIFTKLAKFRENKPSRKLDTVFSIAICRPVYSVFDFYLSPVGGQMAILTVVVLSSEDLFQ